MSRPIPPPRPLEPGEAWCTKCREVKPAASFVRNKRRPNGLAAWCKGCLGSYARGHKSNRQAYFHRRKTYGSNLLHVPIGAKRGELQAAATKNAA